VRALGLRPPANAAPPSRLRVIVRWGRRGEQCVLEAHVVAAESASATIHGVCLLRLGLRDRSWVACDAGDERAEGEEGERVDDEEMCDEVVGRAQGQIVVVEQDVQDGRMRRQEEQDRDFAMGWVGVNMTKTIRIKKLRVTHCLMVRSDTTDAGFPDARRPNRSCW